METTNACAGEPFLRENYLWAEILLLGTTMNSVIHSNVTYQASNGAKNGYLAEPADKEKHGGVIVIQEWWGLNEHIKDVTRRFANEGFIALAPDLYDGKIATDPQTAMKYMMGLKVEDGVATLLGAVNYLKSLKRVEPKKLGVVGFCMGGSYALELAIRSHDLAAVAPFYPGRVGQLIDQVNKITAPIFAPFGERDDSIPLDVVKRFQDALEKAGKTAEIKVYPGCDHAFLNDTGPSYNAEAARDAWQRTLKLFKEHII
jgi:carboxymethylenebutenolidase